MVVTVKVLASIEVTDVELRITDSENGGKGKVHELVFPKPAGQTSHARHGVEPNGNGYGVAMCLICIGWPKKR